MSKYLVKVKEGKKIRHAGAIREGGYEFEMTTPGNKPLVSASVDIVEVLEENTAAPEQVQQVPAKPIETTQEVKAVPKGTAVITKTAEGSEIVDSFPMGANPNPALLKAKIAEVEQAEASGTLKVEEDGGGAPAGERFQIVKKSGAWQNVVDTETGAVLNEKGMKMEDALAFKAKLIESAAPTV